MSRVLITILIAVVLLIIVLMLLSFIWVRGSKRILNRKYESRKKTVGNGFKSALVIYQPSKHNAVDNVLKYLIDILLRKGYKVTSDYPNLDVSYDVESYDLVAFLTPVYMGSISKNIEDFIDKYPISNKKVLICTVGLLLNEVKETDDIVCKLERNNIVIRRKTNEKDLLKFRHDMEDEL